eukprot:Skav216030  [mRNA]  locus=scaffold3613:25671:28499:+ [translate_table: standard]
MCLANQFRNEPKLTFEEFCQKIKFPPTPDYPHQMERARQAIVEETEANSSRTLPVFIPGVQVAHTFRHGHEVYSKAGVVSEQELVELTGKTGEQLGLTPWSSELGGPTNSQTLFLISLKNLPDDLRDDIRKIKVFYQTFAGKDSLKVTPTTQISTVQATSVFEYALDNYQVSRPKNVLTGDRRSLKTIPELIELGTLIDQELKQQMHQDGLASTGMEAVSEAFGERAVVGASKALEGLTVPDAPPAKRKKTKSSSAPTPAAPSSAATSSAGPAGMLTDADSAKSGWACRIATSIQQAHGDTAEYFLLQRRIRLCTGLQRLSETPKLYNLQDFKDLLMSVKPVWKDMPVALKAKITFSNNHVLLEEVSHLDLSEGQILSKVRVLVDAHMPATTAADWNAEDPSFSALINEAYLNLEQQLQEAASSGSSMEGIGKSCSSFLQD